MHIVYRDRHRMRSGQRLDPRSARGPNVVRGVRGRRGTKQRLESGDLVPGEAQRATQARSRSRPNHDVGCLGGQVKPRPQHVREGRVGKASTVGRTGTGQPDAAFTGAPAASPSSRDLPIPAGPSTIRAWPRPDSSSFSTRSSVAISMIRFTSCGGGCGPLPESVPISRHASTGFDFPFIEIGTDRFQAKPDGQSPCGRLADQDCARLGGGLQPGCNVGHVSQRDRVVAAGADHSNGGRAGVHSDADIEVGDAPRRGDLAAVLLHTVDDAQGCQRRPLGVVFVGDGHTEEYADAVAGVGLHKPAQLLGSRTHTVHALADQHLHLVRGEAFAKRGGADDVGEHGSHRSQFIIGHGVHGRSVPHRALVGYPYLGRVRGV